MRKSGGSKTRHMLAPIPCLKKRARPLRASCSCPVAEILLLGVVLLSELPLQTRLTAEGEAGNLSRGIVVDGQRVEMASLLDTAPEILLLELAPSPEKERYGGESADEWPSAAGPEATAPVAVAAVAGVATAIRRRGLAH